MNLNLSHEQTLRWIEDHRAWRPVRKTRAIWARRVEPDEVGKTFRTIDQADHRAGANVWLCVGVAGEPWFQEPSKVEAKYERAGEEARAFDFDDGPRLYTIYRPRADVRNWAARIEGPGIAGFTIRIDRDPANPLVSPAGGYVVRDDADDPYRMPPGDVWLVQEAIFLDTYEPATPEQETPP